MTHTLNLDTRVTSVTRKEYTSVGTATLDGETLDFAAKAHSGSAEFRAQGVTLAPVTWAGDLRRKDGTVVARIGGSAQSTHTQGVQLEFPGQERAFAFVGSLSR